MKKILVFAFSMILSVSLIAGCSSSTTNSGTSNPTQQPAPQASFNVGMVTDSGSIDDKSFNQAAWEGVKKAADTLGIQSKSEVPASDKDADFAKAFDALYAANFKVIVCPDNKLQTALGKAQDKYTDAKFVMLNGQPQVAGKAKLSNNTVAIQFNNLQAGYIAGFAVAQQLKEGSVGFIGGKETKEAQLFNWGFQQGIIYANDSSTKEEPIYVEMAAENFVYDGDDEASAKKAAAKIYDSGAKAIFCTSPVGIKGVIEEAKARTQKGTPVWVIGAGVDQYAYADDADKAVILTSAVLKYDVAINDMVNAEKGGTFQGGKTINYDVSNNGVGIPDTNPNLDPAIMAKVTDLIAKINAKDPAIIMDAANQL